MNGQVSIEGNSFGDVVEYSCKTGYNLTGNATRICRADGSWSGKQPSCESKFTRNNPMALMSPELGENRKLTCFMSALTLWCQRLDTLEIYNTSTRILHWELPVLCNYMKTVFFITHFQ